MGTPDPTWTPTALPGEVDRWRHVLGSLPGQTDAALRPPARGGGRYPVAGVGLGLAVARGFAEAMGGRIVAKDTPGGGLTVAITLTAATADKTALETGS